MVPPKNEPQYLVWIASIDKIQDDVELLRYQYADTYFVMCHNPWPRKTKACDFVIPEPALLSQLLPLPSEQTRIEVWASADDKHAAIFYGSEEGYTQFAHLNVRLIKLLELADTRGFLEHDQLPLGVQSISWLEAIVKWADAGFPLPDVRRFVRIGPHWTDLAMRIGFESDGIWYTNGIPVYEATRDGLTVLKSIAAGLRANYEDNANKNGRAAKTTDPSGDGKTSSTKLTASASKSEERLEWLTKAMLLVKDHPNWSDAEISRQVGRDKSALSRSPLYQAAAAMARASKGTKDEIPKGHETRSVNGLRDVEAGSSKDDPAKMNWDE